MNPFLSIVVPLYNEEESVDKLVARILEVAAHFDFTYEIILIDDGSKDRTWKKVENSKLLHPQIVGIKFRRNSGQTSAMVAGFDHAEGDIIVTLDGDLQNDDDMAILYLESPNGEAGQHYADGTALIDGLTLSDGAYEVLVYFPANGREATVTCEVRGGRTSILLPAFQDDLALLIR